MQRPATLIRAHGGLDAVVVGLAAASLARIWLEPIPPRGVTTALALLATLPLLARRALPLAMPIVALASLLVLSLVVPGAAWEQLQLFLAALTAFWVIGSENSRRRALVGLGAGLVVAAATVTTDASHRRVSDYVFAVAITTAAWVAGVVLGSRARAAAAAERRAEGLAREHDLRARQAVVEERSRIARELHDVIAHTVSVMVIQAGAAEQMLEGENVAARAALASVRNSGKGALLELRRLLAFVRDDETAPFEPQPSLARLDELVKGVEAADVHVEVRQGGEPRMLAPGLDQAAYRIVQEALTNAIKHGGRPVRATVAIDWQPNAVVIAITDNGAGARNSDGAGHGLVGMRERAELYGGDLSAGARPEGGFAVRARLPL